MGKKAKRTSWGIVRTVGLTLLSAGVATSGAVIGTVVSLGSEMQEARLNVGLMQGSLVFTILVFIFGRWGDYRKPGWFVSMLVSLVILGLVFLLGTPILVSESDELMAVCKQVLRDSGILFPTTQALAQQLGGFLLLLFPLLIVTFILDLLFLFTAPIILLTSSEVWDVGWPLVLLELGMVIGGSISSFLLGHRLRQRFFLVAQPGR